MTIDAKELREAIEHYEHAGNGDKLVCLIAAARALLSSSKAEGEMREELKIAAEALMMAGVKIAPFNSLLSLGLRQASLRATAALSPRSPRDAR